MNSKKDKQPLVDCDTRIKEIRIQLNEQLKCLDQHTESRTALLNDIQDFFKRKSEIESEYARKLDVLSEKYITKQRNLYGTKKEMSDLQSPVVCWFQMLEQCQHESKDHNTLSSIYLTQMMPRLQTIAEDATRLHKKNREITIGLHEDFLKDLRKLYQALQLYQSYWVECVQAENKYRLAEKQFDKHSDKNLDIPKMESNIRRSTSFRKMEKLKEKRHVKYSENKLKCMKARNEYILQLEATNATMNKYYGLDIGSLLDAMGMGYHGSLQRMWNVYCEAETAAQSSRLSGISTLKQSVVELDPTRDKISFIDSNNNSFSCPPLFSYTGATDDDINKISLAIPQLHKEVDKRYNEMERTVQQMAIDQDELKKTVEASSKSIQHLSASIPCSVSSSFVHKPHDKDGPIAGLIPPFSYAVQPQPYLNKDVTKMRNKMLDIESYYLQKFEESLKKSNQLNRLQARHNVLEKALREEGPVVDTNIHTRPRRSLRKLQESGRSIPLVVESCVRVINLYGLHHQGIFRVPGSHQEITEMKKLFENGEDPVSEREDEIDINTVSGLLKLYFRQLDEKLFPRYIFDDLVQCAHMSNIEERTSRIRQIILNVPESVLIVMRYLFAFLNHLSQNSDENMMDAYNIAVCFGPTLMPVPDGYDQVTCQANVNEIIKTIVLNHEEIFPIDMDGPMYEKVMASDDFVGDSNIVDSITTDTEISAEHHSTSVHTSVSDDDSDQMLEGLAKYDYNGRSDRELSFVKGDMLTLYRQASEDWWEGSFKGKDGLVPHAYIIVQDYISDGASDAISSRTESEISLDSGGASQSPHHSVQFFTQPSNRRLSADTSRNKDSKTPMKTKSLDRYNNAQEYIQQHKLLANKAAKHGLVSTPECPKSESYNKPIDQKETVDPASLTVAQRIAHFRSSINAGVGPDTLQDIDTTMKNALDQLQALDAHGQMSPHKPAPDVVLDTLDSKQGNRYSPVSESPTHSSNELKRGDDKPTTPRSSGHWKPSHFRSVPPSTSADAKKSSKNTNNNNVSHYQVPTHCYQDVTSIPNYDFTISSQSKTSFNDNVRRSKRYDQQPSNKTNRKTAL